MLHSGVFAQYGRRGEVSKQGGSFVIAYLPIPCEPRGEAHLTLNWESNCREEAEARDFTVP